MKFEITDSARADFSRLKKEHQAIAKQAFATFAKACGDASDPNEVVFPASLRVKAVQGAPSVFEMTWSFAGPDGRATFEWVSVRDEDGVSEPMVRWRRIGTHKVLKNP